MFSKFKQQQSILLLSFRIINSLIIFLFINFHIHYDHIIQNQAKKGNNHKH